MDTKHETIVRPDLVYCFVDFAERPKPGRFFVVPSEVVARYVKEEHALWLDMRRSEGSEATDTDMRTFRIGLHGETYVISTPTAEDYEENWGLICD